MNNATGRIAAIAVGALVLVLGSTVMSSLARPDQRPRDVDLTSSAHPTNVTPAVNDRAVDVASVWGRSVRADTSALSSVTCDDCRGDATTLQVIYTQDAGEVEANNAAVAWSHCTGCGGTALSVQVVVVDGGRRITADNRAFAANAACDHCDTASLAYQLVVVAPDAERLSNRATDRLRDWVRTQSRTLRESAVAGARRDPTPKAGHAVTTLERLVNGDLDSRTDSVDVDGM
jgi:hypothetical protein